YDLYAGQAQIEQLFAEEPGTYLLTDYLITSFDRAVIKPLGLDRHPDLWSDYFGNYTRLVWLAQRATTELEEQATRIATRFNLPLTRIDTGTTGLEAALASLIEPPSWLLRRGWCEGARGSPPRPGAGVSPGRQSRATAFVARLPRRTPQASEH